MATLKDEHRRFIIESFAAFSSLDEIDKGLQDIFGMTVPKSTILRHNPETVQGDAELAEKWKMLFAIRRKHALEDVGSIPIASLPYRLRRLQKIIDDPVRGKSPVLVMQALEHAAKDMGGLFARAPLPGQEPLPHGEQSGADKAVDFDPNRLTPEEVVTLDRLYEKASRPPCPVAAGKDEGAALPPEPG